MQTGGAGFQTIHPLIKQMTCSMLSSWASAVPKCQTICTAAPLKLTDQNILSRLFNLHKNQCANTTIHLSNIIYNSCQSGIDLTRRLITKFLKLSQYSLHLFIFYHLFHNHIFSGCAKCQTMLSSWMVIITGGLWGGLVKVVSVSPHVGVWIEICCDI